MADHNNLITRLQMRNATLEAENRLIKAQLTQSQVGAAYMIDLAGAQHHMQRQEKLLQQEVRRLRNQIDSGQREVNQLLSAKLDSALEDNERLTDQLEASRRAAEVAREQKERARVESPVWFGSWVGSEHQGQGNDGVNDAAAMNSVAAWIETSHLPASTEECKRGQAIDPLAKSECFGSNDAQSMEAFCSTPSHEQKSVEASPTSMTPWKSIAGKQTAIKLAAEKASARNEQDKKAASRPVSEGLRIEASNGETFYVHSPSSSPMQALTSTDEANKHQLKHELRRIGRSVQRRFQDHEHNRLAGAAGWIEDYSEEEYEQYWIEYASEHHDHSAREWRKYYENNVRPGYLAKMAARDKHEKTSGSGGEKTSVPGGKRKDSAFAVLNEGEARKIGLGIEGVHGESGATDTMTSVVQPPLIDFMVVEEEKTLSARPAEMPRAATAEQSSDHHTEKQLQNPHFDIKKYPKESGKKAPQRFFHTANINSRQETRMFSSEKSSIRNCYLRRFFDYSTSKPPPIISTSSPSLSSILLRLYATC